LQSNWTNKPQERNKTIADENSENTRINCVFALGIKNRPKRVAVNIKKMDVNNILNN
jgi:hypothetical protein